MNVGILGLGLIGGSLARAYSKAGHTVYAAEKDESMLEFAQLAGAVTAPLTDETIAACDLILLAIYAAGSAQWLQNKAALISKEALVIDCCGIKTQICNRCFPVAKEYGFTFVGGHPMAGSHYSGFKYSRSNLFQGAPMVLVPPCYDDPALLQRVQAGKERAAEAMRDHKRRNFQFADAMEGALAKREELLEVLEYNHELILRSLNTGKRIPDDRKILVKNAWW